MLDPDHTDSLVIRLVSTKEVKAFNKIHTLQISQIIFIKNQILYIAKENAQKKMGNLKGDFYTLSTWCEVFII